MGQVLSENFHPVHDSLGFWVVKKLQSPKELKALFRVMDKEFCYYCCFVFYCFCSIFSFVVFLLWLFCNFAKRNFQFILCCFFSLCTHFLFMCFIVFSTKFLKLKHEL